jgi:uncharacterized membrane protein YsdA (DUF1294 family)/cold shock CspA family protein
LAPADPPAKIATLSRFAIRPPTMRLTGTLTDWKDDKGFGFVTPVGVGAKAFVHASSFPASTRRPRVGDRVTYELDPSSAKGPRAVRVQIVGEDAPAPRHRLRAATVMAMAFLAGLGFGVATQRVPAWLMLAVAVASAIAFIAYALDKQAARDGRRRIPEDVLLGLGVAGGWPGAAFAQQWLRHKSSKPSFQAAYWFTVAINVAIVAWTASREVRRLTGFSF